jgi:hypothetical protein
MPLSGISGTLAQIDWLSVSVVERFGIDPTLTGA